MKADVYTNYEDLIPTFYTEVFKEKTLLQKLLKGVDLAHMQVRRDTERNAQFASALEPDPLHTSVIENIYLTKSERTTITYDTVNDVYDGSNNYGDQATNPRAIYDLGDKSIKSIGYVANGIDNPTKIYTEGIDFFIDNGLIIFCRDLQTIGAVIGLFPDMPAATGDKLVHEPNFELVGYNVRRDKKELNNQFGYILGVDAPPTTIGRDVFTGMWKLHSFGPSWYWTMFTLARAFGTDIIRTKKEKVIAIKTTSLYGVVVITDRNTYNITSGSAPDLNSVLSYGYPVSGSIKVLHELGSTFTSEVPGVTNLEDSQYGQIQVFGAVAEPDPGNPTGELFLRPQTVIIVQVASSLSDIETGKLIDIFEEVLPKNTRLIIIFNTQAVAANTPKNFEEGASPLLIETVIMEGSTAPNSKVHSSKLRLSTR